MPALVRESDAKDDENYQRRVGLKRLILPGSRNHDMCAKLCASSLIEAEKVAVHSCLGDDGRLVSEASTSRECIAVFANG